VRVAGELAENVLLLLLGFRSSFVEDICVPANSGTRVLDSSVLPDVDTDLEHSLPDAHLLT